MPFTSDGAERQAAWAWLERYWRWALPGAEVAVADDGGKPFSKSCSVNTAASSATGDVYVIMDADCYMDASALVSCAEDVRRNRSWWMPYRGMWRLGKEATQSLLETPPEHQLRLGLPPIAADVQGGSEAWKWSLSSRDNGALCQVIPARGFWHVGGMDPRFRGWGGEDSSFAMALDTLWAPRSLNDSVHAAHLWHARIGEGEGPRGRMWEGQSRPRTGVELRNRYTHCRGKPGAMRRLVNEGARTL